MTSIISNKKANFGLWHGQIRDADPREYRRGNVSDIWLPLREKRWQYIGVYGQEVIAGIAIVHAGDLGVAATSNGLESHADGFLPNSFSSRGSIALSRAWGADHTRI